MARWTERVARANTSLVVVFAMVEALLLAPLSAGTSWAFTDVPTTHFAAPWINWLYGLGLVSGFSDGSFRPTDPVNRGQMATFLGKAVLSLQPQRAFAMALKTAPGELQVVASGDPLALKDPLLPDPTAAGYRLDASADGLTYTPASLAVYEGEVGSVLRWNVTGYSTTTYFRPTAIYKTSPPVERPLATILAFPQNELVGLLLHMPLESPTGRVPALAWYALEGTAYYIITVGAAPPAIGMYYAAAVDGDLLSLLYGTLDGPGVIWSVCTAEALPANTDYQVEVIAINGLGWSFGYTRAFFTTGL